MVVKIIEIIFNLLYSVKKGGIAIMSKYFKYYPSSPEEALIHEAAEAAKCFYGLTDANQYFTALCDSNPGFVQLGSNVYRYKDYYINIGKRFLMAGHGRIIMDLAEQELSCLPQGVAVIWLDNDEDMVLITRIKGSEGHRLVPYSEYTTMLSEQARKNLLSDVDRLLEKNQALISVTKNKNSWHVIEGKDRIILSRCELAYASDEAKPAFRRRVLEALDLQE